MTTHQRLSRIEARRAPSNAPGRVRVCVRLRPAVGTAQGQDALCVRGVDSHSLEIFNWRNKMETMKYRFDAFYGETATQQDVYMGSVQPVLRHLLEGQNASILAYGPTGAGKTHTMLGSPDQPGVIPRAVRDILQMTREASGKEWKYSVSMSYLEIYQEKVLDLLQPSLRDLPIREDCNHHILVPGLTQREIVSFADFESQFLPACSNRTVASTQLNQRSSRSHAVLLVRVTQKQGWPPYASWTAKLCLIDLAGSEDNRRTGNKGVRLKESGAINTSLFVLSKVVDALNQGLPRVPYRDSKLTRLLQDSLGGSAHSVIITNIAPEKKYYFDTLTSLNFAAKSKQVVNKPFTQETVPGNGKGDGMESTCTHAHQECEELGGTWYFPILLFLPTSALLPLETLEPSVVERLLRLEALEKEQARAGNCAVPLLNTPRKERQGMWKLLDETLRELKVKGWEHPAKLPWNVVGHPCSLLWLLFSLLAYIGANKVIWGKRHRVGQECWQEAAALSNLSLFCSIFVLQTSAPDPENEAPPEWEVEVRPDLLNRSKDNILAILNTGSVKDLMALRQIGKKKAQLILGWRDLYGSFEKVEDIGKVHGISAKQVSSFLKVCIRFSLCVFSR
uniref:Kinesin-like protein n=1 Tax=Varanus komodoensis TaxID=61221 RepID=A0A8D2KUC7_VARKO